ncbi:MAG: dicarboxylate/amino acid:cation symporter [Rhodanobacteraceae bacterium]|nr:dicarboxylate/amino acid:cation symporter [Rhodanobacteraceae bacterium]HPF74337.1 dicarboxylate/amino acid:cation symporter [Xanthomonadaceae bacterium]HRY00740.1 dicarboxylate/amino acid:cation symporter [Xanthomonadaceae bacterium]
MTQANKPGGMSLTVKILIGMALGLIVGTLINSFLPADSTAWTLIVTGLFEIVGKIFVASLKMLVVPLVFVSLVCGTSALDNPARLGRVGGKSLLMYLGTTALAVTTALLVALLFNPGVGADLSEANKHVDAAKPLSEIIIGMVPENPVAAMAEGNMLQIIVFSILFGLSISLAGRKGKPVQAFFESVNEVVMRLVGILMALAPYGVFALIATTAAIFGLEKFKGLLLYFFIVLGVLLLHALVTYPILLTTLARVNPLIFLRKMRPAMLFAFSTASSNATLPVTLHSVEKRLGASNSVSSFTIPLGATINMDGTAIMQGVATVFIANAYNHELTAIQLMTVVLMATLASIGTAGVPGVGLVMLAGVLTQVGLPVEAIGLVLGVDRLLDMTRTAVNITGDAMVTCVVAKSEGELDLETFNNPEAGLDEIPDELADFQHG